VIGGLLDVYMFMGPHPRRCCCTHIHLLVLNLCAAAGLLVGCLTYTCSWVPHLRLCCSSISRWWVDLRCPPTGAWGSTKAGEPLFDENIYAAAATHVATSQHTEQSGFDAGQLVKALSLCCSSISFVVCHRRWGYRTLGAVAVVVALLCHIGGTFCQMFRVL
jgi:hypothetical protein